MSESNRPNPVSEQCNFIMFSKKTEEFCPVPLAFNGAIHFNTHSWSRLLSMCFPTENMTKITPWNVTASCRVH